MFDATYKAALENDPENPGQALAAARTAAQTAAPNAPSAAMGGQPAAAPSAAGPSLQDFLTQAQKANPNVSVEDLTKYYNENYGG